MHQIDARLSDRGARVVERLRLRTRDTTVRLVVQSAVEEALRLTSLPGEEQGRIYVFRRLRLPAFEVRAHSSRAWIERCSRHLLASSAHAVHVEDAAAAQANVVFFHSRYEPWLRLVLHLSAGGPAREWFWPEATGVAVEMRPALRLERTLERWRAEAAGWAMVGRELCARLDVPTALAFVRLLPPAAVEQWLTEFGSGVAPPPPVDGPRVRDHVRAVLHGVQLRVREDDGRLLFLAALAVLDAAPATPEDATLPAMAAHLLVPARRVRPARDEGRAVRDGESLPATADVAANSVGDRPASISPAARRAAHAPPALETPGIDTAWRTRYAGLYFLLHPLRRLGIERLLEKQPALARRRFVERVLLVAAVRTDVDEDDPILWPLFDDFDRRAEQLREARTCGADHRSQEAVWARAVRMWCWRSARMTLREIVSRPGRVYATPTSIDVTLPMSTVEVRIRRCGLDLDPGYVPWFARVVHFHYHHEDAT